MDPLAKLREQIEALVVQDAIDGGRQALGDFADPGWAPKSSCCGARAVVWFLARNPEPYFLAHRRPGECMSTKVYRCAACGRICDVGG